MNKTISLITSRVSCREYSDKNIPLGKLHQILEAGKMAPSAMNRQIANILCVRSKRYVEQLRQLALDVTKRDCFYGAKTMVIVHGPSEDRFVFQDCSCVLENIFVAANALKVQSCWINQVNDLFESPQGKKLKKKLSIPEDHRVVGTAILGYAKDPAKLASKERREDFVKIK